MTICTYRSMSNPHCKALTAALLNLLQELEIRYAYLLSRGWHTIIKVTDHSKGAEYYQIEISSDQGDGSYAAAKMSTLETLGLSHTGNLSIRQVTEMAQTFLSVKLQPAGQPQLRRIEQYQDVGEIPDDLAEWLRDELGFAPYLGGICTSFEGYVPSGDKIDLVSGDILIAFSGASQEQDVMFATYILRTIIQTMKEQDPLTSYTFDVGALMEVPAIRLWLELLLGV